MQVQGLRVGGARVGGHGVDFIDEVELVASNANSIRDQVPPQVGHQLWRRQGVKVKSERKKEAGNNAYSLGCWGSGS